MLIVHRGMVSNLDHFASKSAQSGSCLFTLHLTAMLYWRQHHWCTVIQDGQYAALIVKWYYMNILGNIGKTTKLVILQVKNHLNLKNNFFVKCRKLTILYHCVTSTPFVVSSLTICGSMVKHKPFSIGQMVCKV